jgi:hypothetical protein
MIVILNLMEYVRIMGIAKREVGVLKNKTLSQSQKLSILILPNLLYGLRDQLTSLNLENK